MDLYPAIDLRGGRCVRLLQGDYSRETAYGDDPVAMAQSFAAAGARWIHVVDLDAARSGDPVNRPVVGAIAAAMATEGVSVQTGGGVRSVDDAVALADAGVSRVVMGTAAVRDRSLVDKVGAILPVAVGLDHRAGHLAVAGWTDASGVALYEALTWFPTAAAFVITDINRDGMLAGPDIEGLAECCRRTDVPIIASGGVSSLDDLVALREIPIAGVITGKAIYEGRFGVADALEALA
jgi:phosphoribosylformimino-5-aminoimidazole carboxamide ribotide isomerase